MDIYEIFKKNIGMAGRMITQDKMDYEYAHPDNEIYFNANIFVEGSYGKVWYGDIDFTLDEPKLKLCAKMIGKPLYLLKELDGRFKNEDREDFAEVAVKVIKP